MAKYQQSVAGGASQFTGVAEATGLHVPELVPTNYKLVIDAVMFYTAGAITTWTLSLVSGTFAPVWLTESSPSLVALQPGKLPGTATGQPFSFKFVTVGMALEGTLLIDYHFEEDPGDP